MAVDNNSEFKEKLQAMVQAKQIWFNENQVPELLSEYRLLHTCVKNIYDMLSKKNLIAQDPYRLDKRISTIVVPDTDTFPESEDAKVLGSRFSDYETMLDFICTYYRFSVDALTIPEIKKFLEFNSCFDWKNISTNSGKSNSRAMANVLNQIKKNSPSVIISMLNDSVTKNAQSIDKINSLLNELGVFQREYFKAQLRKDMFEHPEFNTEKAFSSPENELAEIKRLYTKITGKKVFYSDLVNEIIEEDQGANKEKLQESVLKKLEIKGKAVQEKKKKVGPDAHKMLMEAVFALGAIAPTLIQLQQKLADNFNNLFAKKKGFMAALARAFRQALKIKEKERFCNVKIADSKTGAITTEKISVTEMLANISHKSKIYNGISLKAAEYQKIDSSPDDSILSFLNHQISECQSMFTHINALDNYFKTEVDVLIRPRLKGMQIELSSFRNSIINVNKKRGEYISHREESEQMKKLGIHND